MGSLTDCRNICSSMRSVDLARCREVRHGWFVETVTIPSPDPNHQRPDEAQLQNQAERREARVCQPTAESHTHERNGEKVKPVWPRHQMFSRPKPESVLFHESECARRCGGRQRNRSYRPIDSLLATPVLTGSSGAGSARRVFWALSVRTVRCSTILSLRAADHEPTGVSNCCLAITIGA